MSKLLLLLPKTSISSGSKFPELFTDTLWKSSRRHGRVEMRGREEMVERLRISEANKYIENTRDGVYEKYKSKSIQFAKKCFKQKHKHYTVSNKLRKIDYHILQLNKIQSHMKAFNEIIVLNYLLVPSSLNIVAIVPPEGLLLSSSKKLISDIVSPRLFNRFDASNAIA